MAKQGRQRAQRGQGSQGGGPGQGRQTRQELRRVAAERASQRKAAEQASQRRRLIAIGGAIAAAVVIAAVLIIVNWPEDNDNDPDSLPAVVAAATPYANIPFDGRFLGSPDAPVTLVEYGDYQCPFCGLFAREISPQFIAEYVATGKVRFEFRDLVVVDSHVSDGHESHDAAVAAACALDQGRFWQYHDSLYNNQHGENAGAFSQERLRQIAQQLGLNMDQFNSCIDGGSHDQEIEASQNMAQTLGVNSTPSFLLNDQVFQVASYDDLKAKLDEALAAASAT